MKDAAWLAKMTTAIHDYWLAKNARNRNSKQRRPLSLSRMIESLSLAAC